MCASEGNTNTALHTNEIDLVHISSTSSSLKFQSLGEKGGSIAAVKCHIIAKRKREKQRKTCPKSIKSQSKRFVMFLRRRSIAGPSTQQLQSSQYEDDVAKELKIDQKTILNQLKEDGK
ncbi:hypothetical protein V1477_000676 [Vespula maculifrons]|uniref:Uncharacterized protein n=1 Tax=Vespula maculifrons TaxID=7453 RepID=A0ABD2D404_VESMC